MLTWGNVSGKPSTFPPSGHNHDDRYYTESEINSKNFVSSDKSNMSIQWSGTDWNKSEVGYVACWKNDGTQIHTVPVGQFANIKTLENFIKSSEGSNYASHEASFSLPSMSVGDAKIYNLDVRVTSYQTINFANRSYGITLSLPSGGTYFVLDYSMTINAVKYRDSTPEVVLDVTNLKLQAGGTIIRQRKLYFDRSTNLDSSGQTGLSITGLIEVQRIS